MRREKLRKVWYVEERMVEEKKVRGIMVENG